MIGSARGQVEAQIADLVERRGLIGQVVFTTVVLVYQDREPHLVGIHTAQREHGRMPIFFDILHEVVPLAVAIVLNRPHATPARAFFLVFVHVTSIMPV
jgi:hypothetical protein